jgi:hypothetical protein
MILPTARLGSRAVWCWVSPHRGDLGTGSGQTERDDSTPQHDPSTRITLQSTLIHSLCINLWMTVTRESTAKVINRTR